MEMDDFTQLVQSVNGLLWGMYCLIPLLVGTGIYLTIKLRFIQIRRFGQAFRKSSAASHSMATKRARTV